VTTGYGAQHHGFVWHNGSLRLLGALAVAINERGQVLGYAKYDNGGTSRTGPLRDPVLWDNGKTRQLSVQRPQAFNDDGQIIGWNDAPVLWWKGVLLWLPFTPVAINDLGEIVGELNGDVVVWQAGQLTDLGPGDPTEINDRGEIVGWQNGDAVIWRAGLPTDIGPGRPVAINKRGEVTGVHDVQGETHAFLWRNGTITDLGSLGGGWSVPTAISNRGQVVGDSADATGLQSGFVWQHGGMTRLPAPDRYAGDRTRALAINDHNQIVGDDGNADTERPDAHNRFSVLWTLGRDGVLARTLLFRRST
jgi:probable HAF family extracellular repeat protein